MKKYTRATPGTSASYTYNHESLNQQKRNDHFLVSEDLLHSITNKKENCG
jgi:hypothetical protein